MYIFSEWPG